MDGGQAHQGMQGGNSIVQVERVPVKKMKHGYRIMFIRHQ